MGLHGDYTYEGSVVYWQPSLTTMFTHKSYKWLYDALTKNSKGQITYNNISKVSSKLYMQYTYAIALLAFAFCIAFMIPFIAHGYISVPIIILAFPATLFCGFLLSRSDECLLFDKMIFDDIMRDCKSDIEKAIQKSQDIIPIENEVEVKNKPEDILFYNEYETIEL